MYKKILSSILIAYTMFLPVISIAADTSSSNSVDPTLEFFVALLNCQPGVYMEKNNLAASTYGSMWLKHQIIGSEDGACFASLTTPDGRIMDCAFPDYELTVIADEGFVAGLMNFKQSDPSPQSLRSDQIWSNLKENYCGF